MSLDLNIQLFFVKRVYYDFQNPKPELLRAAGIEQALVNRKLTAVY